jgi:hypothetical protein
LQLSLQETKTKILEDIKTIKIKQEEVSAVMSDLKSLLYGKFGNHINLEPGDD